MTSEQQELPGFHRLDASPGPARPLSAAAAAAQADDLVARVRGPRRLGRLAQSGIAGSVVFVGALALLFRSHHTLPPAHVPVARTIEVAPPPPTAAPQAPSQQPLQPRDWLDLANAARGRRDFVRAEQLYRRVVSLYPSSDDAAAARLAAADLEAQQLGRARDAVALYRELLATRPNGALVEQARAGVARAYFALGERTEEQKAWRELLRAHPRSLFAQEARARLKSP